MKQVVCGDCVSVLARMPASSVDAIVTDPPYGLEFMGKEWDKLGGDADVSTRSAGRAMQESHAAWAAEAFRVLKPGGYLLAFGGSRTSHRLACAIEDVGFEIRDSIVWMYGQGFPKSLDVSKAIDKAAGAEREVVGTYTARGFSDTSPTTDGRNQWAAGDVTDKVAAITAPATDDARKWDGWGTALKPAQEPIVVARKPLSERTVAANVVKHGTGALNIDGCRLAGGEGGTREGEATAARRYTDAGGTNFAATPGPRGGDVRGRWPANVVLSHVPDDIDADGNEILGCRCVGTQAVKRELRDAVDARAENHGVLGKQIQGSRSIGSTTEDVPVWECVPGCPVAALDAQAGPRASGVMGQRAVAGFGKGHGVFGAAGEVDPTYYADEGGVSRFFYQSKATNRERWGYCHDCDVVFNRGVKADRAEHKPHKIEYHPTVKPVDLMRWLVRLVTPPGGLVVDPFCGTGTTGVAAVAEGCRFGGIEREPTYAAIAKARLA